MARTMVLWGRVSNDAGLGWQHFRVGIMKASWFLCNAFSAEKGCCIATPDDLSQNSLHQLLKRMNESSTSQTRSNLDQYGSANLISPSSCHHLSSLLPKHMEAHLGQAVKLRSSSKPATVALSTKLLKVNTILPKLLNFLESNWTKFIWDSSAFGWNVKACEATC